MDTERQERPNAEKRKNPKDWAPPLVVLAGMGLGRTDMSRAALEWVAEAEVLAGGRRLLEAFPEHPGEAIPFKAPLDEKLDEVRKRSKTRRVLVLASGDPLFFGIGRRLVEALGREHLLVLPNITAVQGLFARIAEPWEDVKAVSLHGRDDPGWMRELRSHSRLALFTDARHTPQWIAGQLLQAGLENCQLVVGEDLGSPRENVRRLSPREAASLEFSPLNLTAVLGPQRAGQEYRPVFGLPEEAFAHQAGLITKMEVRAAVLAHLRLQPHLVLWDLGAASGSVSIEAARLTPLRHVVALERNAERFAQLRENIRRFGCFEIQPVHAEALEVLDDLPAPDRVFIGGSGPGLETILEKIAERLRPGGRVVQTAVTLKTLETARRFWHARSFDVEVVQMQVNRSTPIGSTERLEALNPVFIITVCRDAGLEDQGLKD